MHYAKKNKGAHRKQTTGGEVARFIGLCSEQLSIAIDEALVDLEALSISVLDTARHANTLVGTVTAQKSGTGPAEKLLLADSNALQQAIENAGTKLQFSDRLVQRLSNVSTNLAGLADLMQSVDLPITETQWVAVLEEMRATFTMEQERQMFDGVFGLLTTGVGGEPSMDTSRGPTLFEGESRDGC